MRRLAGLGDVTSSATAAVSQYGAMPASASAAVSKGQSLYASAASAAGGNGLIGLAATASGLIQGLPAGQITTLLKSVVSQAQGLASGATGGAAIGTALWPGVGTAIGAAVGGMVAELSNIFGGGPPTPPQGEFRSTAERYVFPGVDLSEANPPPNVVPAIWPGTRPTLVGYLEEGDTYTSATSPLVFSFGVTWVAPPGSTSDSQNQALQIAQAWIAQNNITVDALKNDDNTNLILQSWMLPGAGATGKAAAFVTDGGIALESPNLVAQAVALLTRWYGPPGAFAVGKNPWTKFSLVIPGSVQVNGAVTAEMSGAPNFTGSDVSSYCASYASFASVLNAATSLDYLYYFSDRFCLALAQSSPTSSDVVPKAVEDVASAGVVSAAMTHALGGPHLVQTIQLADTLLIGLAEIAVLVVTGQIPTAAADLVVFHYVTGLQWVWMQAQKEDQQEAPNSPGGESDVVLAPVQHPNFARVLGIVSSYVSSAQASAATTAVKVAQQQASTAAQASALAQSSAFTAAGAFTSLQTALGLRSAESAGLTKISHASTNPTAAAGSGIVGSAEAGLALVNGEWKKISAAKVDGVPVSYVALGLAALGGLLLWRKR